jgi:hypothetical protein
VYVCVCVCARVCVCVEVTKDLAAFDHLPAREQRAGQHMSALEGSVSDAGNPLQLVPPHPTVAGWRGAPPLLLPCQELALGQTIPPCRCTQLLPPARQQTLGSAR